jgi:hypothetical protein
MTSIGSFSIVSQPSGTPHLNTITSQTRKDTPSDMGTLNSKVVYDQGVCHSGGAAASTPTSLNRPFLFGDTAMVCF